MSISPVVEVGAIVAHQGKVWKVIGVEYAPDIEGYVYGLTYPQLPEPYWTDSTRMMVIPGATEVDLEDNED